MKSPAITAYTNFSHAFFMVTKLVLTFYWPSVGSNPTPSLYLPVSFICYSTPIFCLLSLLSRPFFFLLAYVILLVAIDSMNKIKVSFVGYFQWQYGVRLFLGAFYGSYTSFRYLRIQRIDKKLVFPYFVSKFNYFQYRFFGFARRLFVVIGAHVFIIKIIAPYPSFRFRTSFRTPLCFLPYTPGICICLPWSICYIVKGIWNIWLCVS